jgi:hypothetical protein
MARKPAVSAQAVQQTGVQFAERNQQRVECRRIVTFRRKVMIGVSWRRCSEAVSASVHSQVMMSVELKLEPMWPEPACMIMYTC